MNESWKWILKMNPENESWKWILKMNPYDESWKWILKMNPENEYWKWILIMNPEKESWKLILKMNLKSERKYKCHKNPYFHIYYHRRNLKFITLDCLSCSTQVLVILLSFFFQFFVWDFPHVFYSFYTATSWISMNVLEH